MIHGTFMRRLTITTYILIIVGLVFPASALALDMEYYTYNGFKPVVDAFTRVALIFSDTNYRALFFVVITMGIFFGGASHYIRALISGDARAASLNWAFPILGGIMLFLAFFIPTGTLHVYDPLLNRYQAVGGVPDGVVFLAGATNAIERGMVDIVNSTSIHNYNMHAGGVSFDTLLTVSKTNAASDMYMQATLQKYTEDCVLFEMQRPGTTLTLDAFANNTEDFLNLYAYAASPSIFTTAYNSAYSQGDPITCQEAYLGGTTTESQAFAGIQPYFTSSASYNDTIKARCGMSGFNPDDAAEIQRCKDIIQNVVLTAIGSNVTAENMFKQAIIGNTMADIIVKKSPEIALKTSANISQMSAGVSSGIIMNEWLPIMRAVIIAVAVSTLPFLVIFLPTSMVGNALSFIIGFFVWLMCWGITDAITTVMSVDYAIDVFQSLKQSKLGFNSIMLMPDATHKALALFGAVRGVSIMLATVISGMLIKFGGEALSRMGGQLQGSVQAGAAQGAQMLTPQGQAQAVQGYTGAVPTMANAARFDFMQRAGALEAAGASQIQGAEQRKSLLGPRTYGDLGVMEGAAQGTESAISTRTTQRTSHGSGGAEQYVNGQSMVASGEKLGHIDATQRNAEGWGLGGDVEGVRSMKQLQENGLLDGRSAAAANRSLGFADGKGPIEAGMKVSQMDWGVGNDGKLMVSKATKQGEDGAWTVGDGMVSHTGTYNNAYETLSKAHQLHENGHGYSARGMAGLYNAETVKGEIASLNASGQTDKATELAGFAKEFEKDFAKNGEGLTNEAVKIRNTMSYEGKEVETHASHGSKSEFYNIASRDRQNIDTSKETVDLRDVTKLGSETVDDRSFQGVRNGEAITTKADSRTGEVVYKDGVSGESHVRRDVKETVLSHGLKIDHAAQMAQNADTSLVSQVTSIQNDQERQTARFATVAAMATDVRSLVGHTGRSADQSHASAKVGIGGGNVFKAGGETGVEYQSMDARETNLAAQRYNQVWEQAEKDMATAPKADRDKHVAGQLQSAINDDVAYFREHGKWSFGATGTGAKVAEGISAAVDWVKGGKDEPKSSTTAPKG